jgi:urease gamma subunit
MRRASLNLIATVADVLNRRVDEGGAACELLNMPETIELVNDIVGELAEGGRLVAARETDGTLVGFVSKRVIPPAAGGGS